MNKIHISLEDLASPPWLASVPGFIDRCLKSLGKDNWEVSVLFCSLEAMIRYNGSYRQKTGATDVLSFCQVDHGDEVPQKGYFLAGDIVICPDYVRENAVYFSESFNHELSRVLVHGILHLSGLDHEGNSADEPMLMEQEKILVQLFSEGVVIV